MNYPIILALNLTKNHKIEVFVRFYPPKPPFSAIPSTKSGFLCAFASKFFPIMVFMGSLASSIFPMAIRHSAPASFFPMAIRHSAPASFFPMAIRLSAASLLPQRPGQQHFPDGALPRLRLSQGAPPRRPGQQQTSSGGEKYSGLASNLAHLGRIC